MAGIDQYFDQYDGFSAHSVSMFIGAPGVDSYKPFVIIGVTPTGAVDLFTFSQYVGQPSDGADLVAYNRGPNTGMLRSDDCIFYHPLNLDGVEYLYNQSWSVSGVYGTNGASAGQADMALAVAGGSGYAGWYSEIPTEYPRVSGCTHIAIAFWSNHIGSSEATIEIERDHLFTLSSGGISLGDVHWTGAETTSLMSYLSNGIPHMVLCDFNYQGSNNWSLSISLDGTGFVSHGVQDSGTMDTDASWSTPRVGIMDAPSGTNAWLDEVIVWAGGSGFVAFTEVERFEVYRLGGWHYLPMWRYDTIPIFNSVAAVTVGGHQAMSTMWHPDNWDKRVR